MAVDTRTLTDPTMRLGVGLVVSLPRDACTLVYDALYAMRVLWGSIIDLRHWVAERHSDVRQETLASGHIDDWLRCIVYSRDMFAGEAFEGRGGTLL